MSLHNKLRLSTGLLHSGYHITLT